MIEVWFYHLQRQSLEAALPILLERSLARGWRVVVQASSERRLKELDDLLWSYAPESFLPHGTRKDFEPEAQPIYLTVAADNPNGADVRFFVEDASVAPVLANAESAPRERALLLFDGNDEAAVLAARGQWKQLKDAGHVLSYWRQSEDGKWEKQA
ncbi:MAG: DNA polymerase III subunit chi [Methylocystis sp.]|nr:DNA polymerase III subunit chi [Methylocystis sp.]